MIAATSLAVVREYEAEISANVWPSTRAQSAEERQGGRRHGALWLASRAIDPATGGQGAGAATPTGSSGCAAWSSDASAGSPSTRSSNGSTPRGHRCRPRRRPTESGRLAIHDDREPAPESDPGRHDRAQPGQRRQEARDEVVRDHAGCRSWTTRSGSWRRRTGGRWSPRSTTRNSAQSRPKALRTGTSGCCGADLLRRPRHEEPPRMWRGTIQGRHGYSCPRVPPRHLQLRGRAGRGVPAPEGRLGAVVQGDRGLRGRRRRVARCGAPDPC